jgi:hypothetical protein
MILRCFAYGGGVNIVIMAIGDGLHSLGIGIHVPVLL